MDLEAKGRTRMTGSQNENSAPRRPKKKSALPVPVRKVAQQKQRSVLGPIQHPVPSKHSISRLDVKHKTVQEQPPTNLAKCGVPNSKPINSKPSVRTGLNKTPSFTAKKNALQRTPASAAISKGAAPSSARKGQDKMPDGLMSLVDEQNQTGIDFQTDHKAYRSIVTNTGITTTSGAVSEMYKPKRVTEGQGKPLYTPKMMRHSIYNKEPRMSLMDSCKQYQKFIRQERCIEEESASPVLCQTQPKVPESPAIREPLSSASEKNLVQRMQKSTGTIPKQLPMTGKSLGKVQDLSTLSLIEEQKQSGIVFQTDSKAYRSIITNTGITSSASGSITEMFRPQRVTEAQGKPMYTPLQMRNSVYSREPRMSLMDSCKQYRNFLKQARGIEEESASPLLLPKNQPRVAISESPLVKGMKSQTVAGSVYPKYSVRSLTSPHQSLPGAAFEKKDPATPKDWTSSALRTPTTPLMTYGRVLRTETPTSLTPARRVPMQGSKYSDQRGEIHLSSQYGTTAKKLRWADILSAYSPDLPSAATAHNQQINLTQQSTPNAAVIKTTLQRDEKTATTTNATPTASAAFAGIATSSGSLLSPPIAASDPLLRSSARSTEGPVVVRPAAAPQDAPAGQHRPHPQRVSKHQRPSSTLNPSAPLLPPPPHHLHPGSSLNAADAAASSDVEEAESGEGKDGCGVSNNRSSRCDSSASLLLTHSNKANWSAASLGQTCDTPAGGGGGDGGSGSGGNSSGSLRQNPGTETTRQILRRDQGGETESAATTTALAFAGPPASAACDAVGLATGRSEIWQASSDAALLRRLRGELTTSRLRGEDWHPIQIRPSRHGDGGDNGENCTGDGESGDHHRRHGFGSAWETGASGGEVAPARDEARAPVSLVTLPGALCESSLAYPTVASGSRVQQSQQSVAHGSGVSSSSSVQDIFSRLQILEERERVIQNEMQLLRMAMHTEQEGDSNGNHHGTSTDASSSSSSATTTTNNNNNNHHHTNTNHPPYTAGPSSYDSLLGSSGSSSPGSGSGSHPQRQHGIVPQCVRLASQPSSAPPPAPTQFVLPFHDPTPSLPSSGFLCNDAFRDRTTAPSPQPNCSSASTPSSSSSSSSSPDINSNIIAVTGQEADSVSVRVLTLGKGDAPIGWPLGGEDCAPMAAPEKINLFLVSEGGVLLGGTGSHDEGDRVVSVIEKEVDNSGASAKQSRDEEEEEDVSSTPSISCFSSSTTTAIRRSAFEGFSPRRHTAERGGFQQSGVDSGCGGPAETAEAKESVESCNTANIGLGFGLSSLLAAGSSALDSGCDIVDTSAVTARPPFPGQKKKLQEGDAALRQSVDMEVEEDSGSDEPDDHDENVSNVNITSNVKTHSPFVPQAPGLAGRDPAFSAAATGPLSGQPQGSVSSAVKMNPVSVIVRPRVHPASSPSGEREVEEGGVEISPISPPIWTTLALQSAAINNMINGLALSGSPEREVSTTPSTYRQVTPGQQTQLLDVDRGGAMASSTRRGLSLSPKVKQRSSPPKRPGTRTSVSPGSPSFVPSSARRSPLRSTLRQGHGPIRAVALKNPDVFLEALLEDECALYAGRLQSFFKDVSCDREELPDPVARVLNEGDDVHFLPVRDGSAYPRPAREGSAFGCFVPV